MKKSTKVAVVVVAGMVGLFLGLPLLGLLEIERGRNPFFQPTIEHTVALGGDRILVAIRSNEKKFTLAVRFIEIPVDFAEQTSISAPEGFVKLGLALDTTSTVRYRGWLAIDPGETAVLSFPIKNKSVKTQDRRIIFDITLVLGSRFLPGLRQGETRSFTEKVILGNGKDT